MNLVFLEANHDPTTFSVHAARRSALSCVSSTTGKTVIELFGSKATAADLIRAWNAVTGYFDLLSGMGHGNADEFTGQNETVVYDTANSPANGTAKSAIVHLFSCNCANNLGPSLVKLGAKAFVGYTDFVNVPVETRLMSFFVSEAAAFDIQIYNGGTVSTAKNAADAAHTAARAQLEANALTTPEDLAAFDLNHAARVGPWSDARYGHLT